MATKKSIPLSPSRKTTKNNTKSTNESLTVGSAVKFGWDKANTKIGFFITLLLVYALISIGFAVVDKLMEGQNTFGKFVVGVASIFVDALLATGFLYILLKLYDGKDADIADLFSQLNIVGKYLVANLLYALIVIGGLILLIVPGIMWAVRFSYFQFFVVDKKLGPIDALKASSQITDGSRWLVLKLHLASIGILILGVLALLIGLVWAIPTIWFAQVNFYRTLSEGKKLVFD